MGPVTFYMGWRVLSPRMMICCQPFRMMVDWRKPVLKITLQPVCSTPAFTHKIFYFWIIPLKSTRQVLLRTSAQRHKTREQKGQCLLRAAHEERPLITISELFCSTGKQGTGLKCSLLSLVFLVSLVSRVWCINKRIVFWLSPLWHHYITSRPKQKPLSQEILLRYLIN